METSTGDEDESQEEEGDDEEQVDFGSRGSLNSWIRRKREWNQGQIWCGENDKQRHKHTRPVKRLCGYVKFGNANWTK